MISKEITRLNSHVFIRIFKGFETPLLPLPSGRVAKLNN
jgi:hypothetical protein